MADEKPEPSEGGQESGPDSWLHRVARGDERSRPRVAIEGTVGPRSRVLRRWRPGLQRLRQVGETEFEATEAALEGETLVEKVSAALRHTLIGAPLATESLAQERLSKLKALAIFASDNLSSSAYATEEILVILIAAGTAALSKSIPITFALVALAVVVVGSYRQTIRAYPNGGGAYIVASDNLGLSFGLMAGAALVVDYIMTVAVSIAAGVAAITSAAPSLHGVSVEMALVFVGLLTLGNLRGIRESGTIFAVPSYLFIVTFGGMLAWGMLKVLTGNATSAPAPPDPLVPGVAALTPLLLLRAFSSGAAALTGIEAVANGVPSFKPPEARNAITTQTWMVTILALFFLGTTILANRFDIVPSDSQTVVAQLASVTFGHGVLFYIVQATTMLILILAANTAFAGLPMLASVMARDSVMPKQFSFRGDRLVFSHGIIGLGLASALVLFIFSAETTRIIPLYAFGVFTAFTLSEFGMVRHWLRLRGPGWRKSLLINAAGGVVTMTVAVIVILTKFTHGAWISVSAMALLVLLMFRIRDHYAGVARLQAPDPRDLGPVLAPSQAAAGGAGTPVIVPIDSMSRSAMKAVAYARLISDDVTAVYVATEEGPGDELRSAWAKLEETVPLMVVDSPYRSLVHPLLAYVDALNATAPGRTLTVVLPQLAPRWPWQRLLHNQLALQLKKALATRPNVVTVDVRFPIE